MDFQPTNSQEILLQKVKKWYKNWASGSSKQIFSFSGAAGTGKSTSARMIIDALNLNDNYIACAYIGKAVSNLRKNGMNARTIHSLIYDAVPFMEKNEYTGKKVIKYKFVLKRKLEKDYAIIFIDEVGMVNDDLMKEICSFNIPIIAFGDMNQLGPVMGLGSTLLYPDHILTQIMRQKENDPIIMLSQMVLKDLPIFEGNYGSSKVVRDIEMDNSILTYDQILCNTNRLRTSINNYVRETLRGFKPNIPSINDKIVCCQNEWDIMLGKDYPLTNGMVGRITDINRSHTSKGYYLIDFAPDFLDGQEFINLEMDTKYLKASYEEKRSMGRASKIAFDWAYALTIYKAQGSEFNKVLFFDSFFRDVDTNRRSKYTAITRAKESITIVLNSNRLFF